MKSRDFQPWMLRRSWEWWRAGTYPHKRVGCTYPVYTRTPCREFGEKYRDLIVSDLYSKLKEPRYDLAVVLAEIGETIYMVKDLLLGLVKTFTRTGHALKTARHFTLNSEELWLWYRYALLPTMLDIEDLLKAIKPQAKIDRCQTGKPKKSVQLHGRIYTYGWGPNLESTYFPWTQNLKVGVGGAADIIKRVDPSEWGTSAVDVLRAGWEIIPFSFIFDWFVNMGDFLTTLRNVQLEFAQSYATYAVESELKMGIGPYQTCEGVPTLRQVTIERIIDIEPPYHPLVNSEFMNLNRSVDAIALASGMIKNILKSGGKVKRRRK